MQSRSLPWKKAFDALEKAINAEGVHTYPFDPAFPLDVAFFVHAGRDNVRMNRHTYLEVIYVYEGAADIQILERHFPVQPGDLLIVGANLYHRVVSRPGCEVKLISLNVQDRNRRRRRRRRVPGAVLQPERAVVQRRVPLRRRLGTRARIAAADP